MCKLLNLFFLFFFTLSSLLYCNESVAENPENHFYVFQKDGELFITKLSKDFQFIKLDSPFPGFVCENFIYDEPYLIFSGYVRGNNSVIVHKSHLSDVKKIDAWDTGIRSYLPTHQVDFFSKSGKILLVNQTQEWRANLYEIDIENKKKENICEIEQKLLLSSLSPDGNNLAFIAQKNGATYAKLHFLNLKNRAVTETDNYFIFLKGVQPNHGILWDSKGDFVAISAVNCHNGNPRKVLGHVSIVNFSTMQTNSFGIGYFGGWINDNILLTEMPQYYLSIFDVHGQRIKTFPSPLLGFSCGDRFLIERKIVNANANGTAQKDTTDIYAVKDGKKIPLSLDTNSLPWKIWCYKVKNNNVFPGKK